MWLFVSFVSVWPCDGLATCPWCALPLACDPTVLIKRALKKTVELEIGTRDLTGQYHISEA